MTSTTSSTASRSEPRPSSLAEWKRRSTMEVTLSSGATVTLRALTLDELAAHDALPDDLLRVALLEQMPGGVVAEISAQLERNDATSLAAAKKLSEDNLKLRDRIVLKAVVRPKLTVKDLRALDPFDKADIAALAQRRRTVDAAGRRVGADALDTFRATCRFFARDEADEARRSLLLELAELQ